MSCIFTAYTQVALGDSLRSYDRGELCIDDLKTNIKQLIQSDGLNIGVEVIKNQDLEQGLDTIEIRIKAEI
jgi:hypothetical protein